MTQPTRDVVRQRPFNTVLLGLIVLFVGLAVLTLLPFTAPRANDLGYMSMCPFAPWSTLSLLVVAGVIWAIRQYLITRAD
jgi:ABC-type Co2+ transport system permease subunit